MVNFFYNASQRVKTQEKSQNVQNSGFFGKIDGFLWRSPTKISKALNVVDLIYIASQNRLLLKKTQNLQNFCFWLEKKLFFFIKACFFFEVAKRGWFILECRAKSNVAWEFSKRSTFGVFWKSRWVLLKLSLLVFKAAKQGFFFQNALQMVFSYRTSENVQILGFFGERKRFLIEE